MEKSNILLMISLIQSVQKLIIHPFHLLKKKTYQTLLANLSLQKILEMESP